MCACCERMACYNENQMWGHVAKCFCPTCKQELSRLGSVPGSYSDEPAPTDCGRVALECQDALHVGMAKVMHKDYPDLIRNNPALKIASEKAQKEEGDRAVHHLRGDLPRRPPRLP